MPNSHDPVTGGGDRDGIDAVGVATIMQWTTVILRQVRMTREVMLTDAADRCGVNNSVLSRIEGGAP